MKRKVLSTVMASIMLFSIMSTAFAASSQATSAAESLYSLGLFNGTGTDANGKPIFDLDRAPTRAEAVTMLVRLLGKDEEAKGGNWDTPFTDVATWTKPYVGYAYANNLTTGTSATTFGSSSAVTASQYLTFVLRALGYKSGEDFQWNKAWELSDKIGLTGCNYNADTKSFLRGDIAQISLNALNTPQKDSSQSLASKLGITAPSPTLLSQTCGYWLGTNATNDADYFEIYYFNNGKYGCTYAISDKNDNLLATAYEEGTYTVNGNTLTLKRSLEYTLKANASSCSVSEEGSTFTYTTTCNALNTLTINDWVYTRQADAKAVYDGLKKHIISKDNRPKAADYAYLVSNDFRAIRRKYSAAVATYGYVYAYQNKDGQNCILTLAGYKIISNYSQVTLHNLTTGQTIIDPHKYYSTLADRNYGTSRLHYMDLDIEVLQHQSDMYGAVSNIWKGGTNTMNGVFVNAQTMNL